MLDETEVVEVYSGYSELSSRIYVLRQLFKYCPTQTQVMMTA